MDPLPPLLQIGQGHHRNSGDTNRSPEAARILAPPTVRPSTSHDTLTDSVLLAAVELHSAQVLILDLHVGLEPVERLAEPRRAV